jgi:hypothetical protein
MYRNSVNLTYLLPRRRLCGRIIMFTSKIMINIANSLLCIIESMIELEVAEELDEGNPDELGTLLGGLRKLYPHFNIVGGCCGTDMRHMKRILEEVKSAY